MKNKIKKFFQKIGEILKKKWLIKGTTTITLVAVIVAIYMGVNLLLEKVVLPEIDLTEKKVYSLSDETKDKLKNINQEVDITVINYENDETQVESFAEKYTQISDKIKLEKVNDLNTRKDLMEKYSLSDGDQAIIVTSGEKAKELNSSDLITYDYTTYEEVDKTEEAITNAIMDVIIEKKPKIYFMTNHTKYSEEAFSYIMQSIEDEANEVETLDVLVEQKIPEDCDCLVITTLREDITTLERDKIKEYIRNGGELLLMCGPNINNADLSNFQVVLDEYGISIGKGIIYEEDTSKMLGSPEALVEEVLDTELTQNIDMKMNVCLVNSAKITFDEYRLKELGVEYEPLVTTSETAFERENISQNSLTRTQLDSEEQSFTLGAIVTKKIEDDKKSKLIIISNDVLARNDETAMVKLGGYPTLISDLYNNKDIILNSISYLNEREDTITIRKDTESVAYTVTTQQHIIINIIIFAVLPLSVLIVGIIVWQIRRRRK